MNDFYFINTFRIQPESPLRISNPFGNDVAAILILPTGFFVNSRVLPTIEITRTVSD
jgi:hypothetical protein